MKVSLCKTRTFTLDDPCLNHDPGNLVVWWYGPITKNTKAQTVPKVVVFFRRLDDYGKLGQIIRRETAITHLGLLRIGSVWKNGICNSRIEFQKRKFDVSFSSDGWKIISPYENVYNDGLDNPIPSNDYKLHFSPDRNYLLDFHLRGNNNLLIPCIEFLTRCYGRSAEVRRVLTTYSWKEAQHRFFKPMDGLAMPGVWPIKLARRMKNDDVIFLAHVLYDSHAYMVAKSVCSQSTAEYTIDKPYSFLKVSPWFKGQAQLSVAGITINGGKTFLGLRIHGGSHPKGETILRDKENTKKANLTDVESEGEVERVVTFKGLRRLPDIVDLTDDDEPDHGASSLEIEEDDFEVLGDHRKVVDVWRNKQYDSAARIVENGDETLFSTGEPYGSGKGVGYAVISSPVAMESQGVLRDMWNAVLHLHANNPEIINYVEWFTFEDGFRTSSEPRLIALEPFKKEKPVINNYTRKWLYSEMNLQIPRGVLIIRVQVFGKSIYIFEIQRRIQKKKDYVNIFKVSEEKLKGLVFVVEDQSQLYQWIRHLLAEVRHVKGVVERLVGGCPGVARAFKHASASGEQVPCEAAVRNALGKAGVKI